MPDYISMLKSIELAKSKGFSQSQWLAGLCVAEGISLSEAEGHYLGLLNVCCNMDTAEKRIALYRKIRFADSVIGEFTLVTYRHCNKKFNPSGLMATTTSNLTLDEVVSMRNRLVRAKGKESVYRLDILHNGKCVKSI